MSIEQKYNFGNKVAVVTGGNRGLGKACVELLLEYGCKKISVFSVSGSTGIDSEYIDYYAADVGKKADIDKCMESVYNKYNRIDILINCAGVCIMKDFIDITESDYDKVVDINMKGTFFTCQSVIPKMIDNNYGRIVNISSTAGITGGSVGAPYGVSKAGVIALTQQIGRKYASQGIITNCVAPGEMTTDMTAEIFSTKEIIESRAGNIPVGKIAEPKEVAEMVVFLASDLTTYMTGETYRLSGGRI
jgi:3-oxoacyl-[acyl-carrier protein] reductase